MSGGQQQGCNVYVQGIPPGVDTETLRSVFRAFGNIADVVIFPPKQFTHAYGFVQFSTPLEASAAINFMDGFDFAGNKLSCRVAQPKGTGKGKGKGEDFTSTFSDFAKKAEEEAPRGGWNTQQAQAQGFNMPMVQQQAPAPMVQQQPQAQALAQPQQDPGYTPGQRPSVAAANRPAPPIPEGASCVYVKGLPMGMTQEMVTVIFGPYGEIDHVKVLPNKGNNPLAGNDTVALVNFTNGAQAKWVVDNLNGNIPEGLNAPIGCKFADTPDMKQQRQKATGVVTQGYSNRNEQSGDGGYGRSSDRGGGRDGPYDDRRGGGGRDDRRGSDRSYNDRRW